MAMRGFGSRFLRMSLRHDHMKNALNFLISQYPINIAAWPSKATPLFLGGIYRTGFPVPLISTSSTV